MLCVRTFPVCSPPSYPTLNPHPDFVKRRGQMKGRMGGGTASLKNGNHVRRASSRSMPSRRHERKVSAKAPERHSPLSSKEGTTYHVLTTFAQKPRPEYCADCLACAIFARQQKGKTKMLKSASERQLIGCIRVAHLSAGKLFDPLPVRCRSRRSLPCLQQYARCLH